MNVVEETSAFSVAVVDRVVVIAANGQLTLEHVAMLARGYERLGPGPFCSITLAQTQRPGAHDDARKALAALSARYKDRDVGSAVVMTAGGFGGAIIRGIVGGLTLIAGGNIKVCSDVDGGIAWLESCMAKETLDGWNAPAIKTAVTTLAARQLQL